MKIAIRVDASHQIGTGHVMRCLTLAENLRAKGTRVVFVCRNHPGHLSDMVEAKGFEVIRLESGPDGELHQVESPALAHAAWLGASQSTDADLTIAALQGSAPWDWIIVDHYALDHRWERALRPHCRRIMVIDDLADREHDCDLLLDQNLVAHMTSRYNGKVPAHCGLMLGPEYALLQPQYADLHPRVPPREGRVRRILVSFGGADSANLTRMAIAAFLSLGRSDIVLDVVVNPASPHLASIERQIAGHENIFLHKGLPSLATLMVQADLAIGAGGATSWERCCLGLPSLVITLAENQKPIAAELDRQGYVRWLGHKDEVDTEKLAGAIREILNTGVAPGWSSHCQGLVYGRGTERVAGFLHLDSQTRLKTRPARRDDEDLLLQWANDPLVRRNAFHPQAIDPATHRKWFFQRLRDLEHCRLVIVETENGLPIGQVRFELTADGWEIDYALDPRARSRGLGKPLLQAAMLALRESTDQTLVFARVKSENAPSHKIFEGLDFQPESRGGARLSIAVCSDAANWFNAWIPGLLLAWLAQGHTVAWAHDAGNLPGGDLCFYLSYGRIVDSEKRSRYRHNLVVHESDLPKGRGWSPMTWQILEGENRIPVTLFEAVDAVDAGRHELVDELRAGQGEASIRLCRRFVREYPEIVDTGQEQTGEASYYARRRPAHSRLDPDQTIREQFDLLRVVDNERYPAWFELTGQRYLLRIERISIYYHEGHEVA